jgi:tetratricopeptide (TPR) repeat protein
MSSPTSTQLAEWSITSNNGTRLNLAFRHFEEPTRGFELGLVGNNRHMSETSKAPIVFLGRARFHYLGEENVSGAPTLKFKVTGEAMEGKDATVWFDKSASHLVKVESAWPNSNDWTSYKLELNSVERMTPLAWQDFKAGVVDKHTRRPPPYVEEMSKAYTTGGLDAALKTYAAIKESERRAPESDLNNFGYDLMERDPKDAVILLEFALKEFQGSANLHDSLGEAYMRAGDKTKAIANYNRSLELDPSNDNAVEMLKKLRGH